MVLDTNVLLRAVLRPSGPSGHLWHRRAELVLCASAETVAEFAEVCSRAALRAKATSLTDAAVEAVVAELRRSVYVEQPPPVTVCRDPHDDKFIACALAADAQYLVTEDKDLLELDGYEGLRIVPPAEFARLLDEEDTHD
ncbi:MAG: putative toxin-antitoxin system toxin component, PIN family [Armatimonadetes bacterium]|nr:putative toxin-antitoxin system toxin component, PIN family [Armatimonadota bacterium]